MANDEANGFDLDAETVDVSDLLKVDFPGVSENVVKTFSENAPKNGESADLAGYNPEIHETPPRKNKRGEWAKKRGNKRGYDFKRQMNLPPENIGEPKTETAPENAPENAPANEKEGLETPLSGAAGVEISTEQAAAIISSVFYFSLEKFSDYDAPQGERAAHKQAAYDYLMTTGGVNLPPWGMLACISAQSVLNACAQPKAKTRMQKFKEWLLLKIYGWRNRRKARTETASGAVADAPQAQQ